MIAGNYTYAAAVAKSDTVDQAQVGSNVGPQNQPLFDAIYVGGAGNLIIALEDNTTVTLAVTTFQIVPIRGRRVGNSSTATLMFALYYL